METMWSNNPRGRVLSVALQGSFAMTGTNKNILIIVFDLCIFVLFVD